MQAISSAHNQQLSAQRLVKKTAQPSNLGNHLARTSVQTGPAYQQPQTTNAASRSAGSHISTANGNQRLNSQMTYSSVQSATVSPQQAASVTVPSSSKPLNARTPSWSPPTAVNVPASSGHSHNIQTPVPTAFVPIEVQDSTMQNETATELSTSPALSTGISQARRASDETRVTGGSSKQSAAKAVRVPTADQTPRFTREQKGKWIARSESYNDLVTVDQAVEATSDTVPDTTVRASGSQAREHALEAENSRLKAALNQSQADCNNLLRKNDKLDQENIQWITRYGKVTNELSETKKDLVEARKNECFYYCNTK